MLTTHHFARSLVASLTAASLTLAAPVATAQEHFHSHDNTGMNQHVAADEQIAPPGERVAIRAGHIDIGPLLVDGQLKLLFRDDSSAHPVWRRFEDAVFILRSEAENTLPAGHEYDFTGATGGQRVWAVPQNQVAGVPWMGWSTQAPSVADIMSTGVTFSFGPHEGAGEMSLFVQSGGFGGPDVIYRSDQPEPQTVFVDLHTHAHMNWVFTEPGTHRLTVGVSGMTKTGQELHASSVITFVVGDGTAQPAPMPTSSRGQVNDPSPESTQQTTPAAPRSTIASPVTSSSAAARPSVSSEASATAAAPADTTARPRAARGSATMTWLLAGVLLLGASLLAVATVVVRRRRSAVATFEATDGGRDA